MSSECVCHIEGEWCFYCEVHSPVVAENERLKAELRRERMWRKGWENTAKGAEGAAERLRTAEAEVVRLITALEETQYHLYREQYMSATDTVDSALEVTGDGTP